MKNHEYIRQLPVEELAKILIKETEVNEGDYDYDDEPSDYYVTYNVAPDGTSFYDFEDALQYTIEWLKEERRG